MSSRPLHALPAPAGSSLLDALLPRLAAALDGTGPALLALPADPGPARRVRQALRPDDPAAALEREDVALVVPTTGSTGEPKGVMLSAAALTASAQATSARLSGPGRWLLAVPASHIAGLQVLVRSLVAGTVPAVLDLTHGFTPEGFAAASAELAGDSPRYTALVPTQLVRLLDAGGAALAALASYDAVLIGGVAVPPALLRRARGAGVRAVVSYGMTETCGGCVYDGRPLDGVGVAVDADGRIRVRGPMLFAGYRLRPDLTATALVDGELVTGDLGRLDAAGRLRVLGRADELVVTGGEKVALVEVEEALAEHPCVRAAAAVALPDREWGQRVVAVVVLDGSVATLPRSTTVGELRDWVTRRAGRAATPREVLVVQALPLLGPGKVDRGALRTLAGRGD